MSSITEQVGRVVGGRYRLLAPVGVGASSQVFAAVDARLGRRVAVKVLHPMLADDAAFLRRFRAEARLAASLDHPHVMRVFDWGEEDAGPYLVLEFLGGGSLRQLLDSGTRLSHEQVAHIGFEAAMGLAYAHRRGIVHRDIKPGNLLFDDEGHLRIADFGVARALAEAALTEPMGTIFGTARYASPEQAEGRPLDDRTDVYSLALVMYEALTGRVPFTADTVSATLMARIGAALPLSRELGPLAPVIAQAAIAEPLARLDANALVIDLETLSRELPAPAPLPLQRLRLEDYLAAMPDRDPTDVDPAQPRQPSQPSQPSLSGGAAPVAGGPIPKETHPPANPPPLAPAAGRDLTFAGTSAAPAPPATPAAVKQRKQKGKHRWLKVTAVIFAVLLLAAGGVAAFVRFGVYGHDVPPLKGLSLSAAEHKIQAAGLKLKVESDHYSLSVPKDDVISQSIAPGHLEKSGVVVGVVVSLGLPPVSVPSLKGDTRQQADTALTSAHLKAEFPPAEYSETVTSGKVISWSPNTGLQPRGTTVKVIISKGPHPRVIPAVGHGTYAEAASALESLQLVPKEVFQTSTEWQKNDVIGTIPAEGTSVPRGHVVEVVVSSGPPLTTVPYIRVGESLNAALKALRKAGLVPKVYGPPGGVVFDLSDNPGERVPLGSIIFVYTI